ncbi:response regulator transcription factor [Thalassoroseus pseudoceratinae]|uniref:response regulator transcription factor n=1 Tax=Thalassoroseus pseudoceratinae TaxID=2713176 RepID=UPI00141DDD3F|nr:response regulator transcription factor [Thalassoroseus pseudoceratinae]
MKLRILTIEDDPAIRRGLVDAFEFAGFEILEAGRGDHGLKLALECVYDLLVLDLVLPGMSGLDILKAVRIERPTVPIIILSARGDENDRVAGLRLGADDYVVKPFSIRELTARVEAVLRRSPERSSHDVPMCLPHATIDFERGLVEFDDGTEAELTEREADLLRYLRTHAGRVISREELMSHVWRIDPRGLNTRAIDMQVARLREKLRDRGAESPILRTVRGRGYELIVPEVATQEDC